MRETITTRSKWQLLHNSKHDQRLWGKVGLPDLYIADHSGDDRTVGNPDSTDDGPLRIINDELELTVDVTKRTEFKPSFSIPVVAERTGQRSVCSCGFETAMVIANLAGKRMLVKIGNQAYSLVRTG